MPNSTAPTTPVIRIINQLPSVQQNIIVRALNGNSVTEISRTLNLPFLEVKSHIYSALTKLQMAQLQIPDGFEPTQGYYYYDTSTTNEHDWLTNLPISSQLLLNFNSLETILTHLQNEQPQSGIETNVGTEPGSGTSGVGEGAAPSGGGGGSFDPGDNAQENPGSGTSGGGTANPPNPNDTTNPPVPDTGDNGEVIGPPNIDPINTIFMHGIDFEVYYKPSLFLTEIEYTDDLIGIILNYPPTAPIAKFYPLLNNQKEFMISLEPSVGFIREKPQYIYQYDIERFADILLQQNSEDGKVAFKYQGDIELYQMFRIENEPTSYLDFSTDETRKTSYIRNENVLFKESIQPNKIYYYTFRTKDLRGSVSNPSPIFAVKLYVNDGVENLDVREFVFKQPTPINSLSFKKFLQISPNLLQTTYSYLEDKLGLVSESIYNRNFLLRVKSKHSGKMMDLIIRFNKTNGI